MAESGSHLEKILALLLRRSKLPTPEREYRFTSTRRFRADFAWPSRRLAVEVHGGTWTAGRHVRGVGIARDAEKHNLLTELGWRCLYYTTDMLKRDGVGCVEQIERVYRGNTQ